MKIHICLLVLIHYLKKKLLMKRKNMNIKTLMLIIRLEKLRNLKKININYILFDDLFNQRKMVIQSQSQLNKSIKMI